MTTIEQELIETNFENMKRFLNAKNKNVICNCLVCGKPISTQYSISNLGKNLVCENCYNELKLQANFMGSNDDFDKSCIQNKTPLWEQFPTEIFNKHREQKG